MDLIGRGRVVRILGLARHEEAVDLILANDYMIPVLAKAKGEWLVMVVCVCCQWRTRECRKGRLASCAGEVYRII